MSLEKRFVDADLFDADDSYLWNQLDDSINEKERKTMWQQLLDGL